MKKSDLYISPILAVFGLYIAYEGYLLKLGSLRQPRPGFLIFWSGLVLSGLCIALFIRTYFARRAETDMPWEGVQWVKVIKLMASLILFTLTFKWVGFFLSSFLLLLFLLKGLESQKWSVALAVSVVTILVCYVIFGIFLEVRFPEGFLEGILKGLRT